MWLVGEPGKIPRGAAITALSLWTASDSGEYKVLFPTVATSPNPRSSPTLLCSCLPHPCSPLVDPFNLALLPKYSSSCVQPLPLSCCHETHSPLWSSSTSLNPSTPSQSPSTPRPHSPSTPFPIPAPCSRSLPCGGEFHFLYILYISRRIL